MDKRKIKVLALMVIMLWSVKSYSQADSIMRFSLQEAIDYALENNALAKNASLEIRNARMKIWETTAIGLPQASGYYDFQHIPGELPSIQFDPAAPPIELGVKNSATYGVKVSQLVFSGEYIVGLQAAQTYKQLSENNLEKTTLDVKESVIQGFFAVLILEENLRILENSYRNIQSMYNEVSKIAEAGLIESTEADQLELTLNNTKNAYTTIKRHKDLSRRFFKILIGVDVEKRIELTDSIDNIMGELNLEQPPIAKFSLTNNIDYRMLETQEKLSFLSLRREQSRYLPSIAAFYAYTDVTNAPEFDFTIHHILGLSVEVPIFSSGMRHAKVQQARINLEQTQNSKEMLEQGLTAQFIQARADYLNALDQFSTVKMNLELSEKILHHTSTKFKEGMASSMDFTVAQNQYLLTQSNYYTALMTLLNAKVELEKLLNNL